MTASSPFETRTRDRFFRSMVLMGGTLALGCGGVSVHDSTPGEDTDDIEVRGGAGGGSGSAGASGMAGAAGTRACADEQRTCTAFACYNDVWEQQGRCFCDFSRPTSAADCAAGTILVCRPTLTDPETGAVLAQPTRIDCQCVPAADSCNDACVDAYPPRGDGYHCAALEAKPDDVLCGCVFVYLK